VGGAEISTAVINNFEALSVKVSIVSARTTLEAMALLMWLGDLNNSFLLTNYPFNPST
jgi:hypothetical protein